MEKFKPTEYRNKIAEKIKATRGGDIEGRKRALELFNQEIKKGEYELARKHKRLSSAESPELKKYFEDLDSFFDQKIKEDKVEAVGATRQQYRGPRSDGSYESVYSESNTISIDISKTNMEQVRKEISWADGSAQVNGQGESIKLEGGTYIGPGVSVEFRGKKYSYVDLVKSIPFVGSYYKYKSDDGEEIEVGKFEVDGDYAPYVEYKGYNLSSETEDMTDSYDYDSTYFLGETPIFLVRNEATGRTESGNSEYSQHYSYRNKEVDKETFYELLDYASKYSNYLSQKTNPEKSRDRY